jgi:hypothetical protein
MLRDFGIKLPQSFASGGGPLKTEQGFPGWDVGNNPVKITDKKSNS